jgi:hypothetical protein
MRHEFQCEKMGSQPLEVQDLVLNKRESVEQKQCRGLRLQVTHEYGRIRPTFTTLSLSLDATYLC